jgi:carboxyl-terminal processing protease
MNQNINFMKKVFFLLVFFTNQVFAQSIYQKDFSEFWTVLNENYAYFEQQKVDWNKVRQEYEPLTADIHNRDEFIRLLEHVVNELHNGHISLNTNLESSNRIIPSGSDIFVQQKDNAFFITDIRKNYPSERSGLKPGMQVIKFNGKNIETQLSLFLPTYTQNYNPEMVEYALNMLFAGTHDKKRSITVLENGIEKEYTPDNDNTPSSSATLIEYRIVKENTGYIKINNSLGNDDLIPAFDNAMDSLQHTNKIIIDITETPGGGNSAVARAIMGRFIEKEMPFQKHEMTETQYRIKRSWTEFVVPRNETYKNEVILLVGHWTGSMGEGIAIGFDGMDRGKVIGTKMAGLIGAISQFRLSITTIGFQFPTERVYHINGTPREDFKPRYLTEDIYHTWSKAKELCRLTE